jgi:hypothetical protein
VALRLVLAAIAGGLRGLVRRLSLVVLRDFGERRQCFFDFVFVDSRRVGGPGWPRA